MEKSDRDPTHAMRAEDEYRQMILQFPDSQLVPQAKERLLEVQEVLARREYEIGHFYYMRESFPAAIARLKSVSDTYPLYSGSDDALFELGMSYEREADIIRRSKLAEVAKGELIKKYEQGAVAAYDRILTVYPLETRSKDAEKRLEAMKAPVPKATPQAIAADKAQIDSRNKLGTYGKVMENFHKGPDVSEAAKVGEPTLVDPKQASAPDMVRSATDIARSAMEGGGGNRVSVERVEGNAAPPPNAPVPHSDASAGTGATTSGAASDASAPGAPSSGSEMQNDLPASGDASQAAPMPPPTQVNDLANSNSSSSSSSGTTASSSSTPPAAAPANADTESSSKKKKKHKLLPF
jgi:outer membrane protein assembly factor BamD